jgi:UDP-glucose 4-epimerase
VAAIVHRKDIADWDCYRRVNVDLTAQIARKARSQGVRQFVFLSSMAVYGAEKSLSAQKSVIAADAAPAPTTMYGRSKHLAEQALGEMESEGFRVAIVRPPNVYGPGCRGSYISTYAAIVSKLPAIPKAFPSVRQSVLYIDNLSRFIYLLICRQERGIYTPQDDISVSAVTLMEAIRDGLGLTRKTSAFLGAFVYLLAACPLVRKGYGGISYRRSDSHQDRFDYVTVPFAEGIRRTVRNLRG